MKFETIDWRAVAVGALVEAVALFVFLAVDLPLGIGTTIAVLATMPVLAGAVVGLTSRGYNGETLEGSFAAAGGIVLTVLASGVVGAATADGLSLAYRLDVLFLVVVTGAIGFCLVAPVVYILGGLVASRVSRWRHGRRTEPLEVRWAELGED